MKQNKIGMISIGLSILFSGAVSALELSEMRVRSMPGEPLEAIVQIEDVPRNVKLLDVDLATEEEFSRAVIGYSDDLDDLEFEAYRELDGKVYVLITTEEELEEEVVHFILAVKVANARLLREYVIIEEDDIYTTHAQPTIIQLSEVELKENQRLVVLPQPVIAIPSEDDFELAELENESEIQTEIVAAGGREEEEIIVLEQRQYRVKAGDTLWVIAKRNVAGQNKANFYKVLAALKQLNPKAFIDNNVNQLRPGSVLTLPTIAQVNQMDLRETTQVVHAQLNEYSNPTAKSAVAENTTAQTAAGTAGVAQGEQLRILTPQTTKTTAEASAQEITQLRDELALSNESLTQVQRNNEALQERINALESQIATLKELVAAREQQVTEAQNATTASESPNNQEATPGLMSNATANDLWYKLTTGEWSKYLVFGLVGLIILLVLIRMLGRRRSNDNAEYTTVTPQTVNETDKEFTEVHGEDNENEDLAVKLELAQAYYDIGDTPGARILLQEVIRNGNLSQRHEAESLMAKIEMDSRQK